LLTLMVGGALCFVSGARPGSAAQAAPATMKTETFDRDPGWDGHNNRSKTPGTRPVKQEFGYSKTGHAPGGRTGEIGGFVCPAAEPAYYAKAIPLKSLNDSFSASGTLMVAPGGNLDDGAGNTLLG